MKCLRYFLLHNFLAGKDLSLDQLSTGFSHVNNLAMLD